MFCLGTNQLPCSSTYVSSLRQSRGLPNRPATRRRHLLRCQADEKDKTIADKVPEAAQKTIDALSALLGRDENEDREAQPRPLQGTTMRPHSTCLHESPQGCRRTCLTVAEEPQKEDSGVRWWSVPPSNQTAAPRRCLSASYLAQYRLSRHSRSTTKRTCCACRSGTDPGSAGRALNEGGPGQQRTGKPMKLGSNKFDIPTVRLIVSG